MAKDKLDYIRQVEVVYDSAADIARGPVAELSWGTQKSVDNTAAVLVLAWNSKRTGLCIQAKSTNTGKVYLGFTDTVTTTRWFAELQAGMAFCDNSYCGAIYARADVAATQYLGYADW